MSLRIHWYQHVPFEGLGSIETWARSVGASLTVTRWFAGDLPPAVETFDWLFVMGGPMGVADEAAHPWLVQEKACLREAIAAGRTVVGICLGAQLIAEVLGGRVHPNAHREIGWFPLTVGAAAASHWIGEVLPATGCEAFHWHGETFSLPPEAVLLAGSEACAHQIFAVGDRVLGLQCHFEITPASAQALAASCPGDLAPGPFVQPATALLEDPLRFDRLNRLMTAVLDRLAAATARG